MTSKNSKRFDDVRPGEALPELAIPITTTLIASTVVAVVRFLATRPRPAPRTSA